MKLLVGLGNPGFERKYQRHNVGALALDTILGATDAGRSYVWQSRFQSEVCGLAVNGVKVLLLKPMTYMNASGTAVRAAASFYKVSCSDIIVLHDDMDLAVGRLKVTIGGGAAGHNGVRSVYSHVGEGVCRVRIGIGRPDRSESVVNWVLNDFDAESFSCVTALLGSISSRFEKLVVGDISVFMNGLSNRRGS